MRARWQVLLLALVFAGPPPGADGQVANAHTTLIVVRHAERLDDSTDPVLSEVGRERARQLAWVLERVDVDEIGVTQYRRTKETAEPLAAGQGVPVRAFDIGSDGIEEHLEAVASWVADSPGRTLLLVSHSNVLPPLVERLTGREMAPVGHDQYSDLLVLHLHGGGEATALFLRYGSD